MKFIVPVDLRSWIESPPGSHFPIQNVPLGVALIDDSEAVVTRIGDSIVNISHLVAEGLLPDSIGVRQGDLDLEPDQARDLRRRLIELLSPESKKLQNNDRLRAESIVPVFAAEMVLPYSIGAFVDFYSGIHHASNVGKMFRPDQPPLLPNYRSLPVGYNGRASSVVVSGTPITRPNGQTSSPEPDGPAFGPTKELDFELEVGFFLGRGNEMGHPIPIDEAESFILGYVLVNDWSARDVQRWEYQPLGPFLAKSFATSISPWIILPDALEPFRIAGQAQDPKPLRYLRQAEPGFFDIELSVWLQSPKMEHRETISRTNFRELYWSSAQQLCHQASNGTPLQPGDLYASGTISSPADGSGAQSFGSLLELTVRGTKPIRLNESGEERSFLEDGDRVGLTGVCRKEGLTLGFGEVVGEILPAVPPEAFRR